MDSNDNEIVDTTIANVDDQQDVAIISVGRHGIALWPATRPDPQAFVGVGDRKKTVSSLYYHSDGTESADEYRYVSLGGAASQHPFSRMIDGASNRAADESGDMTATPFMGEGAGLVPGLTAIMAPTGWGKTHLMERVLLPTLLAEGYQVSFVRFVEPITDSKLVPSRDLYDCESPAEVLARVGVEILNGATVFLDSLRAFVYDKGVGGTGAGGVDQFLFPQLTALNNLAAQKGGRLVLSINPMTTAPDKLKELRDMLSASVTGVITDDGPGAAVYSARSNMLGERRATRWEFRVPAGISSPQSVTGDNGTEDGEIELDSGRGTLYTTGPMVVDAARNLSTIHRIAN